MSDTQTVIKQKSNYSAYQCCGSGSTWIRIDFGRLDPDPQWEDGFSSGPWWAKITDKKEKSEDPDNLNRLACSLVERLTIDQRTL